MDLEDDILGNNDIKDVSWLCHLSESELDFLMSLKMLVIQRAKVIGCEELAEKFDLKTLRALGLVLMEHLKGKVDDSCHPPDLTKFAESFDKSYLLKCDLKNVMSIEEMKSFLCSDSKKRSAKS
ncbi:hypothetical protein CDL15_Pgr004068 [Punica granatum]|uniref:Gamma-tubulin complex component n=1 Tax=Punica granatum TaxID=22663 RepID=A0A218XG31_PUNGR|nr:hypothetical protein CDL15_Pgr004068 [Punica granatum]